MRSTDATAATAAPAAASRPHRPRRLIVEAGQGEERDRASRGSEAGGAGRGLEEDLDRRHPVDVEDGRKHRESYGSTSKEKRPLIGCPSADSPRHFTV